MSDSNETTLPTFEDIYKKPYSEILGSVWVNEVVNGQAKVLDVRGWGHLTGSGALNLPHEYAEKMQDQFASLVVKLLNGHFAKKKELSEPRLLDRLRNIRDIQASDGNWNYDPYMHGMYNGLELMLSMVEGRDAELREAPKFWLAELPMEAGLDVATAMGQ